MAEMLRNDEFWRVLLVAWLVTPIGMILVGIVFESRIVPLWSDQSRAFMPGDIALGVMFAIGWHLYHLIPDGSFWASAKMPIIGLFVGVLTCILMRTKFDGENNYSPAALRSPTKRFHDFVLYIGYLTAIIAICIPSILFGTSWSGDNLSIKLLAVLMLVVWLVGMLLDAFDPAMPQKRKKMHVSEYNPIWVTLMIWWRKRRLRVE